MVPPTDPKPEPKEARAVSFLKSTTGAVTAVTALLVAIGGLVTVLSQFGGGDSAPPAATPAPAPPPGAVTTVAVETDAQRELRSRIPGAIWPTCRPPTHPEEGAVAAFNCRYREIVELQYNLFASSQELEQAYDDVKERYDLAGALTADSCDAGAFEGDYEAGGRVAGNVLCFVDEAGHVAAIVWTDSRVDILSFAWRNDKNLPALFEAWQKGVGPEQ